MVDVPKVGKVSKAVENLYGNVVQPTHITQAVARVLTQRVMG